MAIKIIEEIKSLLPRGSEVTDIEFEGANIVLYTKNKEFFLDNKGAIRSIVGTIKKRVELRADPSIPLTLEKAEAEIRKIIPKDTSKIWIIFN